MGFLDFFTGWGDKKASELTGKAKKDLTLFDKSISGFCSMASGLLLGLFSPKEIYDALKRVYDYLTGFFGIFKDVWDFFSGKITFSQMIDNICKDFKKMWDAFSDSIFFIFKKLNSWFSTIAGWLGFGAEYDSIINSLKSSWDWCVESFNNAIKWFTDKLDWIASLFNDDSVRTIPTPKNNSGQIDLKKLSEGDIVNINGTKYKKQGNEISRLKLTTLGQGNKKEEWVSTGLTVDALGNLINKNGEKQLDISESTEEKMGELLFHATDEHSIYTHDTHLEKALNDMIGIQQEELSFFDKKLLPAVESFSPGELNLNVQQSGSGGYLGYNVGQMSNGNGTGTSGDFKISNTGMDALGLIASNEGSYGSVNLMDGAKVGSSIGKLQWNRERARNLLLNLRTANPDQFNMLLPKLNANLGRSWENGYFFSKEEAKNFKLYMESNQQARYLMDKQARDDFVGYVEHGRKQGIQNEDALLYYADLANQHGFGSLSKNNGAAKFLNRASKLPGGYTLDNLYKVSLGEGFDPRRRKMYQAIKGFNLSGAPLISSNLTPTVTPDLVSTEIPKIEQNAIPTNTLSDDKMDEIFSDGVNTDTLRTAFTSLIPISKTPPNNDIGQMVFSQMEQDKKSKEELSKAISSGIKVAIPPQKTPESTDIKPTTNNVLSSAGIGMPPTTNMELIPTYVLDFCFGLNITSGGIKSVI